MHDAFKAWDLAEEPLEAVEARIHDGAPREGLRERGLECAQRILAVPWLSLRPEDTVVEVGSGVGYIMQAVAERSGLARVTGLDVAPSMIAHAKARLRRDGLPLERFRFERYDGLTFPWPDATVDLFYSIATIQHIPKPHAYQVLLEMHRCLKPGGTAFIQVLSWDFMHKHGISFATEIQNQIRGAKTHWHHYYDTRELEAILTHGLEAPYRIIASDGTSLWAAWRK
jgi:ubiquinone/menaquinone biosynthesis C-methylase UbiE